jgi:hypothetical protein
MESGQKEVAIGQLNQLKLFPNATLVQLLWDSPLLKLS